MARAKKNIFNLWVDSIDHIIENLSLFIKQFSSIFFSLGLFVLNSIIYAISLAYDEYTYLVDEIKTKLFKFTCYASLIPFAWATGTFAILYIYYSRFFGVKFKKVSEPPSELTDDTYGEHKYASLPGITLHYVQKEEETDQPQSAPTAPSEGAKDSPPSEAPPASKKKAIILFLHGFGETWYVWRNQIKNFSKDYRTVAVDMRGFGDSDKPLAVNDYKLDLLIEDLKHLIKHINPGHKRQIHVVARGWGAVILYCFLLDYPDLINSYITMNAVPPYIIKLSFRQTLNYWYMYLFQIPRISRKFIEAYYPKYLRDLYDGMSDNNVAFNAYSYELSKPKIFQFQLNYYQANYITLLAYRAYGAKNLPLNRMPPGLCMYGAKDTHYDESSYKYIEYIPHLQSLKVLTAGYHMAECDSDLVNQIIRIYLSVLKKRSNVKSVDSEKTDDS